MSAGTFDTHAAVTALREAGLDEAPAVAIVNTVRDAASADHSGLATKADLADLENRLVKWGASLAVAAVVILGILIRWP